MPFRSNIPTGQPTLLEEIIRGLLIFVVHHVQLQGFSWQLQPPSQTSRGECHAKHIGASLLQT